MPTKKSDFDKPKSVRKKKLLTALRKHHGLVTIACEEAGVSCPVYYTYMREDPEFNKAVTEINDRTLDYAESALLRNIQDGKETSLIFFLKCKGKERGYVEKSELDLNHFVGQIHQASSEVKELVAIKEGAQIPREIE